MKVASALRRDITSGAIAPGASLDYYSVGSSHGVGGHVVIKALATLRREQLVMWRDHWWYATPAGPPSPAVSASLGAILAAIRTRLGLTATDLATAMTVGHVSPWETIALRTADILAVEDGAWRGRWLWKQVDAATTANGGLLTVHDYFYSQADVITRTAASATPTTRKGTPMTLLACSCGYEAGAPVDLGDHLGEVFIPGDDTAPDGRVHAEAARDGTFTALAALRCACGFTTGDTASMDGHLLRVFIPDDAIGLDGRKHVCAQAA